MYMSVRPNENFAKYLIHFDGSVLIQHAYYFILHFEVHLNYRKVNRVSCSPFSKYNPLCLSIVINTSL